MATIAQTLPRARGGGRFYLRINILLLAVVFVGFSHSYFLSSWLAPQRPALSGLLHFHGAVATLWLLLMVSQPLLIARGDIRLHKRIGLVGAAVAVLMPLSAILVGIAAIKRGQGSSAIDPRLFFAVPFFGALLFAGLAWTGIALRRHAELHKRLLLMASAAMMDAPIGRLFPVEQFGAIPVLAAPLLTIAAGAIHDRQTRGRVHRIYWIGGAAVLLVHVGRIAIMFTPLGPRFAEAVARLW